MLKTFELDEFLKKIDIVPAEEKFQKLVDEMTYFEDTEKIKKITNVSYERGYILYSLVAHLKPKNILEFGTAQGFGTLCMACAMDDFGINGKIHTVDLIPHEQNFLHYYKESNKIQQRITSRKEIWDKISEPSWIKKIHLLNDYTAKVMMNEKFPPIDFCFIDGPHFYKGVKHDFLSSLLVSNLNPFFLFDDYIDRPNFGVKKLIDEEIANKFNVDLIKNDQSNIMFELGITKSDYGMCTLNASRDELINHFGFSNIKNYLNNYRKYENRLRFRRKLNEKLPFLKKIRFSKILRS